MEIKKRKNVGMELLVKHYKKKFETKENFSHYSYNDFLIARRKYLKYALAGSCGERAGLSNYPSKPGR